MQQFGTRSCPPHRPWRGFLALLTACGLWLHLAASSPAHPAPKTEAANTPNSTAADRESKEPEADIRRPSWGKVVGWVLDATTRQPIADARVTVAVDGAFPQTGKSVTTTRKDGRYEGRAPLGQISSKLDWGRVLTMHPISLLLSPRSVTKQTRVVDVSQVNLRVEAPGYRPFTGRVLANLVDAQRFAITLDDVWLAPESSTQVSFTPERLQHEIFESLTLDPPIAAPGDKVRITLTATLPYNRGHKYRAFATSESSRLVESQIELKATAKDGSQNRRVFSREIKLPKNTGERWAELGFFLVRDDTFVLRQNNVRVLLQVVENPTERAGAAKVAEGYVAARDGNLGAALRAYEEATRLAPEHELAQLLYGDTLMHMNRAEDAVTVFRKLVARNTRDYQVIRSRYAAALLECGQPDAALQQLQDAEKVLGSQRIPPDVLLQRARALAAQDKFPEVDPLLTKAGQELEIPAPVLEEINLRRMRHAVETNPKNAELRLSYARLLESLGQRDEALRQTRKAVSLNPGSPWGFLDLGTRLIDYGEREAGVQQLRHALQLSPNNLVVIRALAEAHRDAGRFSEALALFRRLREAQPLDLRARHHYALMLYATGDLSAAREEFRELIHQAREKGNLVDDGLPLPGPGLLGSGLYFGPKRRLVEGFSVPEAAIDLLLLEALQGLEKQPDSGLLWQNVGCALLDLNLPALAVPALEKSRELAPDLLETRFFLGVALRQQHDLEHARQHLDAVVRQNPLHPRARLELAQLYTDLGRWEDAQTQMLAHHRNYPHQPPPRDPGVN